MQKYSCCKEYKIVLSSFFSSRDFNSKAGKSSLVIFTKKKMIHELFAIFGGPGLKSYKIAQKSIYDIYETNLVYLLKN